MQGATSLDDEQRPYLFVNWRSFQPLLEYLCGNPVALPQGQLQTPPRTYVNSLVWLQQRLVDVSRLCIQYACNKRGKCKACQQTTAYYTVLCVVRFASADTLC